VNPNWPLIIRQIIAATDCEVRDLAQHCGVSKSAVEQWLSGMKCPSFTPGWELLNAYVARVGRRIPQA
jgi:transcriptional regulator with XRE-family HTH domain